MDKRNLMLPVPAFNAEAAQLLGLLARNHANSLREGPDMALGVAGAILPLAIELVGRRLDDLGAHRSCPRAMGIQPVP